MTRTKSGTEIVLSSGRYTARLVTVGAGLAGLTLNGRGVTLSHEASVVPDAWMGKTLIPWPNRIAQGRYTWRGQDYNVPVNEPETGSALHGFMSWLDWTVVHADTDSATLGAFVAARYGYPWALESWVTYALHDETGLTVSISTTNVGPDTAPYGVSSHPFLTVGEAPVDGYVLDVPAASVLEVDGNLIPTRLSGVSEAGLDYRGGRAVEANTIDHAFTDLPDGQWSVTITDPETGASSAITSDVPWVQVYSGEKVGRRGLAVEPMTCAPDAFNSGVGLIELEPGQSHSMTFVITGTEGL